jgi:ferredoxin
MEIKVQYILGEEEPENISAVVSCAGGHRLCSTCQGFLGNKTDSWHMFRKQEHVPSIEGRRLF